MNKRQKLVQAQFLNNEEAVIRRLKSVYSGAQRDIEKKTKELQDEINRLGTMAKLSVSDEEKAQFLSMQQSKIYQKQYQDAMKKQIGSILDNMQVEEFKTVSEYLTKCYEEGFVGTMFDLQGQGIPLCFPMDQEAMVRAVQLDSKISQGLYSRLGEDVSMLKRKISAQVSRGIATGMSFEQVAQQLSGITNIGFNNAVRIARTEGHRIQVQSGMDACYKAKEKGADVVKQWDSTLDSSTRDSHVAVDGEVRELDEKFSNGLMFPGDPSGGAAEVVNCRCALLQRARWALGDSFSKMDNETGELVDFSGVDDYDDFKKQYWAKAKEVEQKESVLKTDHDCELAKKFGVDHYDAMHKLVVGSPDQNASAVWKKYESGIKVADPNYKGHPHCRGDTLYMNGAKDAKGNSFEKPYQVTFHESGHAIDSLARKTVTDNSNIFARHYSSAYKDGLFPQTIKDEVADMVKARDKELKAAFKEHAGDVEWFHKNGFIEDWYYRMYEKGTYKAEQILPKYRKAFAYSSIQKEVKAAGSKYAISDLSDILEGATGAKIQCGFGHGATYWKDRTYNGLPDGLATEAFAEMMDSTFANPESLEMIKKYLPKSYGVFQKMLDNLLQ
jgi:hypothetical protein